MGRIEARYDYTDSKGRLRFRKIRREGKRFTIRWADEQLNNGNWTWFRKMPPEAERFWMRSLYALPEVVAALRVDVPIWWCEGEKDAENLAAATGLVTTTTPNPSDLWDDQALWFTKFRSRSEVIVVCDRDEHGGWWGWERYTALLRVGVEPSRIHVVAPSWPRYKDVSDVLEAGRSLDALRPVDLDRLEACAAQYARTRVRSYVGLRVGVAR